MRVIFGNVLFETPLIWRIQNEDEQSTNKLVFNANPSILQRKPAENPGFQTELINK
jgi:hypothetical protein